MSENQNRTTGAKSTGSMSSLKRQRLTKPLPQEKRTPSARSSKSGATNKTSAEKRKTQSSAARSTASRQAVQQRPSQQKTAQQKAAQQKAAQQKTAQQKAAQQKAAQQKAAKQKAAQQKAAQQKAAQQRPTQQRPAQQSAAKAKAAGAAQRPVKNAAPKKDPAAVAAKEAAKERKKAAKAADKQARNAEKEAARAASKKASATKRAAYAAEHPEKASGVRVIKVPGFDLEKEVDFSWVKEIKNFRLNKIGPTVADIKADPYKLSVAVKVIILILALLFSFHFTSVVNDIMGFNRSDKNVTFNLPEENMSTDKVISQLDKQGLIRHSLECKAFVKLTDGMRGTSNATYLKGDYVLTKNMGIEKMLITCMNIQKQETVQVSIPEGFCVQQIAETLEKNKVCSKTDFLKACQSVSYNYDFMLGIDNANMRYAALEGYLYPDTYEFFMGSNATDVVSKMLSNFNSKWTDAYAQRAAELGKTMDDVLTEASIIQKEDSTPSNMAYIASVFNNRLASANFPTLQSDATVNYAKEYIKPYVSEQEYQNYNNLYSTYVCKGLPLGPICNPGDDAIKAVLWPESTSYYFFAHDEEGKLYLARTANEQIYNVNRATTSAESAVGKVSTTISG